MRISRTWSYAVIGALGFIFIVSMAYSQDKFRLKPGAKGKNCLECHENFKEKLNNPFVHTPVKSGECSGCHNPHTSSHGKLLAAEPNRICSKCHGSMIPAKPRSVHKVVAEGDCTKCHDPHGAANKFSLLKAGNDLCVTCHAKLGEAIGKAKFKHSPVEKGCVNCHDPHASSESAHLLKTTVPPLCNKCHNAETATFRKQHVNYPVKNSRCTSCHNAHGSDRAGILFDTVHRPVANKMCTQCHMESTAPDPFKIKRTGFELCKGCHNEKANDFLGKNRIHWPMLNKEGCLNCHSPHASGEKALLSAPMLTVCGRCHQDTIQRQEDSPTKHEPIKDGACSSCHSPHSSDSTLLINKPKIIDVCSTCHEWQKHSSHPIGEKAVDQRNKNLSLQCLSCHRAHGTGQNKMIPFSTISELCTQCHVQYKR